MAESALPDRWAVVDVRRVGPIYVTQEIAELIRQRLLDKSHGYLSFPDWVGDKATITLESILMVGDATRESFEAHHERLDELGKLQDPSPMPWERD